MFWMSSWVLRGTQTHRLCCYRTITRASRKNTNNISFVRKKKKALLLLAANKKSGKEKPAQILSVCQWGQLFFFAQISSHSVSCWQLEDSGRRLNAITPSLQYDTACPTLHSPSIKFKSNSNQIKLKAVSNVILASLQTRHPWLWTTYALTCSSLQTQG